MCCSFSLCETCQTCVDLGVKPSAPSCPLTLPLDLELPIEQTENQATLPGGVASASVEIQTVPVVVEDPKST